MAMNCFSCEANKCSPCLEVFVNECFKAGPPLDLSFWSFLTFLHLGIEEVERHLL